MTPVLTRLTSAGGGGLGGFGFGKRTATAATSSSAYQISRSLRFNSADSASLSRTVTTAGDRRTWTLSWWMKIGKPGTQRGLFGMPGTSSGAPQFWSVIDTDDQLFVYDYVSGQNYQFIKKASAKLRDTSAWYHCMFVYDSTQSTAEDGFKMYLNGTRLTDWTTNTLTGYTQNYQGAWNSTANTGVHIIGQSDSYFDGYMADIWFVGGSALAPSDFAETDATTGQWVPKTYSGSTSGTNTFHLEFADNSGTTSTTLGKDTSGNSNNFTPNYFSVTAGAGNDSLVDTPTNYGTDTGTGGEVRGNYATWSPLYGSTPTLSNGNLEATINSTTAYSSISVTSGKWYWEITPTGTVDGNTYIGIIDSTYIRTDSLWSSQARCYVSNGNKYDGSTSGYSGASYEANDVIGVALDLDAGTLVFYKNGTSQGTAFSTGLTGKEWKALGYRGGSGATHIANFGQRPFAYPLSGFKALNTQNLSTPTIAKGSDYMDVVTYTGTGSALTPTSSLSFSPDLIWIKSRSAATDHALYDTVRGAQKRLESNNDDAEVTSDGGVTAFNSNGFTLGTLAQVNTNAATYAGWCWDGGSSTVSNSNGTITSSVRANASAGISIISYTGNGTSGATVGHGLNIAPSFYVCKFRNTGAANGPWYIYHKSLGATETLTLNTTNAGGALSSVWNNTEPTSTVFSLGNAGDTNGSGRNFIAYCFAPVSGFSSFGTYTGNGSTDGPFVYLGFRPAFVIVKMSSSTGDWTMLDYQREGYNVDNDPLYPNLANAEGTTDLIDITSNGFKVRTTDATFNTNAGTYVYAAWAQHPFSLARAR